VPVSRKIAANRDPTATAMRINMAGLRSGTPPDGLWLKIQARPSAYPTHPGVSG
jgi:hypothetical protein